MFEYQFTKKNLTTMKTKNINNFAQVALSHTQQGKCLGGNTDATQQKTATKVDDATKTKATATEYIIL
jgi:hypothetical protein